MDEAATHLVDALAGSGPGWLFAIGVIVILAFVTVKVIPIWRDYKMRQLDIEADREKRKSEEIRLRDERDRENAAIAARQIDTQEQSNIVLHAVQEQLAVMNGNLDISHEGSRRMGETVTDMAHKVDEIHGVIIHHKSNKE